MQFHLIYSDPCEVVRLEKDGQAGQSGGWGWERGEERGFSFINLEAVLGIRDQGHQK